MKQRNQVSAAIYVRLSKEDLDKPHQTESESIQNQKSILTRIVVERGWELYSIYCDEDYSGSDRNRPAFQRLLNDAEHRKFNVILVKSQSRFTRDMELVERYIHGLFPQWGIRFVSIVDNADTDVRGNKKARQINGLINEWYLEDLSENLRTVFAVKREKGQFLGNYAPFGYKKDPHDKHHLVVDPPAAQLVQRIFSLYLSGHGIQHIAAMLNQEHIPSPAQFKRLSGIPYNNGSPLLYSQWQVGAIRRILKNPVYLGNLVQGRSTTISYKNRKKINLPPERWIISKDTHQPIISKDIFEHAQLLLQSRIRPTLQREPHIFAGKCMCADCGAFMRRVSCSYKGQTTYYMRCGRYADHRDLCSSHSIRYDILEDLVFTHIDRLLHRYFNPQFFSQQLKSQTSIRIKQLQQAIALRQQALATIYLDRARGVIDQAVFDELHSTLAAEKEALYLQSAKLKAQLESQTTNADHDPFPDETALYKSAKLARTLVLTFLDHLEICARDTKTGQQAVEIYWRV